MFKTIKKNTSAEVIEKKSKFIANLFYIQSQEEAEEKIKEIRKKYYDARHNCYAYSIMDENGIISRSSDDGEPSGTAGSPMLNILQKRELINVLVVVTRYFGGILLGTGGLVKAYSEATISAIENAELVIEQRGYELEVVLQYQDFDKFQYYCQKNNIEIVNVEYDEKIKCKIELTIEEKDKLIKLKEENNFRIYKFENLKEKNIRKNVEI